MLVAMRPHDSRYVTISTPPGAPDVDASARFVVLCWPVIDPVGRFEYVRRLQQGPLPYPDFVDVVLDLQPQYWGTEDAMSEGSPVRILERSEAVDTPPVLYIQGTEDQFHPHEDLERFVERYRAAGGHLELELYEGEAAGFINLNPASPANPKALARISAFVKKATQ
jgi:acetyl esterase/lipase